MAGRLLRVLTCVALVAGRGCWAQLAGSEGSGVEPAGNAGLETAVQTITTDTLPLETTGTYTLPRETTGKRADQGDHAESDLTPGPTETRARSDESVRTARIWDFFLTVIMDE